MAEQTPACSEENALQWLQRNMSDLPEDTRVRIARACSMAKFNLGHHARSVNRYGDAWRVELDDMQKPLLISSHEGKVSAVFAHATTGPGIVGILSTRSLVPRSWRDGGAGVHGCYGFAKLDITDSAVCELIGRCKHHSKNQARVLVEIRTKLPHKPVHTGGIKAEAVWCRKGWLTNFTPESRWCCPPAYMDFVAVWFFADSLSGYNIMLGIRQ